MDITEHVLENAHSELSPYDLGDMYRNYGYTSNSCTNAFWDISNLTRLIQAIDDELSIQSGMLAKITIDNVFFLKVAEHVSLMPNSNDVQATIGFTNAMIVQEIVPLHLRQIKRRKLFLKTFIFQDRSKYMPRPLDTHGRNRVIRPSTEDYYIKDPDARFNDEFQQRMIQNRSRQACSPSLFQIYN